MSDSRSRMLQADPKFLAGLLQADRRREKIWMPSELSSVLRHQLSAPLDASLAGADGAGAQRVRALAGSEGLRLESFGDLLSHPSPPVELLVMVKEFAKSNRANPTSELPPAVATVLYYACIAAALLRCNHRITSASHEAVRDGFRWCTSRPWLDAQTRALIEEASPLVTKAK